MIEKGATVIDSVLLPGARVRSGATVTRAVIDDRVDVGRDSTVGGDGEITLVGRRARVDDGAQIAPGRRFPDPDQED